MFWETALLLGGFILRLLLSILVTVTNESSATTTSLAINIATRKSAKCPATDPSQENHNVLPIIIDIEIG